MVFNRFVRLEIATNGNCFFVANLGYREIRKSQWYRDKIDAGLDYSRGKIRWLRGKEVGEEMTTKPTLAEWLEE